MSAGEEKRDWFWYVFLAAVLAFFLWRAVDMTFFAAPRMDQMFKETELGSLPFRTSAFLAVSAVCRQLWFVVIPLLAAMLIVPFFLMPLRVARWYYLGCTVAAMFYANFATDALFLPLFRLLEPLQRGTGV